ncbi:hypothetical protein [Thermus tengchongensis]|uniref:Uncharacterized protein n=1 Tax=Thermus tengchongensis TaxID=1214928 RepID=A0A4Y9F9T8_9DEIN|nr:hypothetical protein [Thermus tengchongensis]TFU25370.1 hypothetical protein E0687_11270 [Thermus tengchongensis]
MRREGFALAAVLGVMVAVLMLGLSLAFLAQGNLETARNLRDKARAKALAEGGIAHAVAYIKAQAPTQNTRLETADYEVSITPSGNPPTQYEVVSTATAGQATHTAKAVLTRSVEVRSAFREGWFTGGRVSINGQIRLYGARLHGDGGYTLNDANPEICLPNASGTVECKGLSQIDEATRKALFTGSVYATTCNPANNALLCSGGKPVSLVCPVWGNPPSPTSSDYNTPCYDSLKGAMATVGTATRIPAPDLPDLWSTHLGLSLADNPYAKATENRPCTLTVSGNNLLSALATTLAGAASGAVVCVSNLPDLNTALTIPSGVTLRVEGNFKVGASGSLTLAEGARLEVSGELQVARRGNQQATLTVGQNALVVSQNNAILDGQVTVNGGRFLSNGEIQFKSDAAFTNATVYGKNGLQFNAQPSFTDSKVFSGSGATFNGNNRPLFSGSSLLAAQNSITFNGRLQSSANASPLLISGGDVTFNGSYSNEQSASFIWTTGKVILNGNTTYRGGIASGGGVDTSSSSDGIVVNGGLTLYTTGLNNDLLPTYTVSQVQVAWRR